MEKRFFLFLTLSLLVLFVYSAYFAPRAPERIVEKERPEVIEPKIVPPRIAVARPEERVKREKGKDVVVETDLYRLVLTTSGARIRSFRLKEFEEARVREEVWEEELSRVERSLDREGEVNRERLVRERDRLQYLIERDFPPGEGVELVPFDGSFYGNYPLTLTFPSIDEQGALNFALYQPSQERLKLGEGRESGTVEFYYITAEGVKISRRFHFSRDSYLIGLEIGIRNNSSQEITEENFLIAYGPGIGLVEEAPRGGGRIDPFASQLWGRLVRDRAGREVGEGWVRKTTMKWDVPKFHRGPVGWTAMRNLYFVAALVAPEGKEAVGAYLLENKDGRRSIALKMPPFHLPVGGEISKRLALFLGPQDVRVLRQSAPDLERVVDFGFWSMIARPIHGLLKMFYGWFGNYGLSIILLSLTINLAFYPLTRKSFEAMKNMQEDMRALQPEMAALKEKYKNSPQKLQKATLELYKKRGVNPLGGCKGCLPMLFQMPIFFALFPVLNSAIELRQAPFLGWIHDLSAPDPFFVLPVLMGATMYLQQKLTGMGSMSGMGGAGSAQPEQAKIMSIMIPIILTLFFLSLPSGVVLYWLFFNVFTSLPRLLAKKKSGAEGQAAPLRSKLWALVPRDRTKKITMKTQRNEKAKKI